MRNPVLHGTHRNTIDLIPEFDFLVYEMLIPNKRAFITNFARENKALIGVFHIQISGLDHTVQQAVVDDIVAHRFADDHFYGFAELPEEEHLDYVLVPVFLHDLLHHVFVFGLDFAVAINHTEHPGGPHASCEYRVQAVAASCDVEHRLPHNLALVALNRLDVCITGRMVN